MLQYQDLVKKKRTVIADKAKIMDVIRELDEKKNIALMEAWKKVNKVGLSLFCITFLLLQEYVAKMLALGCSARHSIHLLYLD